MPSRNSPFLALLGKELRELWTSRAWWIFLFLFGPLTGLSFISAVETYAEVSVGGGEAFTPLIGIWAPAFSACEIAAAFLLPFVAIRLVSSDRLSGALKLESQHSLSPEVRLIAKYLALLGGWLIAMLAPFISIALWHLYGGAIYAPEVFAVALGHLLNASLTIALAIAAASMAENPSTAAIATLAVTIGTWVLTFVAAIHGGIWQQLAAYTPTAFVAQFQHALVSLNLLLLALALIAAGFLISATWLRIGAPARERVLRTGVILIALVIIAFGSSKAHASWDLSEARLNSFPSADERALRAIGKPLSISIRLAPEDPRRQDFERNVLTKLRRTLPRLAVTYTSSSSTGLFEQSSPRYGEITYGSRGREVTTRATTAESALESIYRVTNTAPPAEDNGPEFRGHPLQAHPRFAPLIFYGAWPLACALLCWQSLRRPE